MCTRSVSILVIFTFVSLFKLTFTYYSPDLLITLSNGNKLMGKFDQTMGGRPVKSFTGIPYAKPPIGNLRFKVSSLRVLFINMEITSVTYVIILNDSIVCHLNVCLICKPHKRRILSVLLVLLK